MASSVAPRRFQRALFVTFAAIALVLALVGTYGVLNYTVSERTREIGVRIAIGAERRTIMRMVLARGFRLGMAGIGIGIGGALALDRIIESLVFGVPATDAWTYLSVCGILLAVALAAASLPALRAIHVDPVEALRHE
jgi:putative ABC transport system permease protein